MGFDHAQWEMWSGSKHGVRHGLKQLGTLGPEASAPSCQTCHMKDGDHAVKTAWGFLGVRLPLPEDPKWAADRTLLLQALGALDLSGSSTERFEVLKALDLVRTSQEEWQERRDQMIQTCNQCHSANFARQQLAESDDLIRAADGLMAEAIRVVAALYKDHLVPLPKENERVFPDLLQFHDAASVPEQKLFVMFMEHRMRTFQGSFHANPDYVTWYGWSEMVRDLAEIKAAAEELRFRAAAGAAKQ
jgi:mono/diheme cytochrome c family protein